MTMHVRVEVFAAGGQNPPAGSSVIVQVRDTAYQDTTSAVMAETRGKTVDETVIAIAELDVPQPGAYPTVFVHVDVDGDGQISKGDYITMQSYPCTTTKMAVEVKKV